MTDAPAGINCGLPDSKGGRRHPLPVGAGQRPGLSIRDERGLYWGR